MAGHSGAVLELHFSTDGERLYTASTDKTIGVWDVVAGYRLKRIKGTFLPTSVFVLYFRL